MQFWGPLDFRELLIKALYPLLAPSFLAELPSWRALARDLLQSMVASPSSPQSSLPVWGHLSIQSLSVTVGAARPQEYEGSHPEQSHPQPPRAVSPVPSSSLWPFTALAPVCAQHSGGTPSAPRDLCLSHLFLRLVLPSQGELFLTPGTPSGLRGLQFLKAAKARKFQGHGWPVVIPPACTGLPSPCAELCTSLCLTS